MAFSVFGTPLKQLSDFVIFVPFEKGGPCDSMQTLHELARFFVLALFGSKTPRGVDFALILMGKLKFCSLLASNCTSKALQKKERERTRNVYILEHFDLHFGATKPPNIEPKKEGNTEGKKGTKMKKRSEMVGVPAAGAWVPKVYYFDDLGWFYTPCSPALGRVRRI